MTLSDDQNKAADDSSSIKYTPEQVEKVSVQVPTFWEKAPELYFANIEAQFSISGVTQDTTKYYAVIASLNSEVLSHISDIVLNPPATGKYEAIKRRLVNEFADSQEKRLKALLSEMVLGDDRPSHLLRKSDNSEIPWTTDSTQAFTDCKTKLANATLLAHPHPNAQLVLHTDASSHAIGGTLNQVIPKRTPNTEPLAFFSAKLTPAQQKWSTFDRELFAI